MGAKQLEGLVRKGIGGFYTVETPEGLYTCTARGKFRKARISPYAGDRVRILAEEDGTGALEEILPRRNFLVRPPIANIDQLFIVSSLRDPYPEPLIVDKTIAVAELGLLLSYVMVSLVIGLGLRRPALTLTEWMERKLESTKVM